MVRDAGRSARIAGGIAWVLWSGPAGRSGPCGSKDGRAPSRPFNADPLSRQPSVCIGYFTYRIFRDVTLERLAEKVRANLDLYDPGTEGRTVEVFAIEGARCSALLMGYLKREEALLMPIGYQLGCVWMDVRYNDGDWWELSVYEGSEHRVNHNPNPWVQDGRVKWEERHFDLRIKRVCELWPDHAERIRAYLLPARRRVTKLGRTRFVPRTGKAYETDHYEYGAADQIHDFVAAFGITEKARSAVVKAG